MVLVTLWLGFKANGGQNGKDFLTRYITLACVLSLWIHGVAYVLYYGVYLALFAALGHSAIELFRLYGPAQLVFLAVTALAFMLSIQHYISRVAVGSTT
jgi:ABC-type sulfate transport system permease subunit